MYGRGKTQERTLISREGREKREGRKGRKGRIGNIAIQGNI